VTTGTGLPAPSPALEGEPPTTDAQAAPWLQRYTRMLVFLDLLAVLGAAVAALLLRFGTDDPQLRGGVSYSLVAVTLPVIWLAVLALSRCYEARFLGTGPEEFQRVFNASIRVTALLAVAAYATQLELARGFVGIALPLGLVLLLLGRFLARVALHRRRRTGRSCHRVLLLGTYQQVHDLATRLRKDPQAGLQVVGACVPGGQPFVGMGVDEPIPVLGALSEVHEALLACGADTVAVTASPGLQGEVLRRLSYDLEGTGVDLLVAPALTNVTGTRISIRPVAGLPLLHLDEPELSGARTLIKGAFDRTAAFLGLLVLLPMLLSLALAVRLGSPGPTIFKQVRVGRNGAEFCVWKFRSMYADAEARLEDLRHRNEHDGVLFKVKDDPRITPLGRWLRKYSLDELPQLVNVLRGEMSLVGPRPPLPSEVAQYVGHTHRRLLVKPGITGLWQVSGRSDLSWEDTVRLDLQYVENWSLGLDLAVLARTVLTVLRGSGAY
jgi:exopolysaccharide biosynthesis polyprenyl glycosylphosphotransferase